MSINGTEPGHQATDPTEPVNEERRKALRAVAKYSAFLAGSSTVVITADQVLAQPKPCSQIGGAGKGKGPPRCR